MKIYTYDLGYRGGLVITANSLTEAHDRLMATSDEYRMTCEDTKSGELLIEHELEGFSHDFYGDR